MNIIGVVQAASRLAVILVHLAWPGNGLENGWQDGLVVRWAGERVVRWRMGGKMYWPRLLVAGCARGCMGCH